MTPTWYTATTARNGEYVEGSTDLDKLVRVVLEIIDSREDVVITNSAYRVVAVVSGVGEVVRIGPAVAARPHGCEFCPKGSMGCVVCSGKGAA